jgi:hypothetical protein
MVRVFLRSCVEALGKRGLLLLLANVVYFPVILVSAFVAQLLFVPGPYPSENLSAPDFLLGSGLTVMVIGIFALNLVLSAFVVVTLPGVALFPLSVAALVFRAVLWGFIVSWLPSWLVLAALPTIVLEGEAYVIAAVAGIIIGASWIKPSWAFGRERQISRWEAFRLALGEGLRLYFWVLVLLFVAAIVETATILLL